MMTASIFSTLVELGFARAARGMARAIAFAGAFLALGSVASAQSAESRWSVEGGLGWDFSLTGDFLSAGIGTLNDVPTIIQSQSFGDVYGTGVVWQFGGGYKLDEINEVRAQFSYQRVGSDLVTLGTAGNSDLVATFDDYRAWSIEAGYRRYFSQRLERLRPYAGAALGVSIIDEIDGAFAAPQAGITRFATDFYDGTAALTLGVNGGVLYALNDRIDVNGQMGFRYNSGLSEIDSLRGTGLEDINDKSARWTLPISFGIRFNF
jgi:Outer membrane protein beta-barrel domain